MSNESFLKKMKRFKDDIDDAFGAERRTETDQIDSEGIKELEISAEEADVAIRTHEKEVIDLELETYEGGPVLETNMAESRVKINAEGRKQGINFGGRFSSQLKVSIPRRLWESISVDTGSGDIEAADVEVNRFGVKAGSGELAIEKVRAGEANLKTSSGEISAKELEGESLSFASGSGEVSLANIRGDLFGKTNSGEIAVFRCEGREIHLKNKSGGIEAQELTGESISFRTMSGEIDADGVRAREISMDSNSGGIEGRRLVGNVRSTATSGEVELDFEEAGRNISVDTNSGEIELRQKEIEWNAVLKIRTSSGDIEVPAGTEVAVQGEKHFEGTMGDGEGHIELTSRSGDIEVI